MNIRRVAGIIAMGAAILWMTQMAAEAQGPQAAQVRMRWQDFVKGADGAKRLASLQKAVAKMKSLDASPKNSVDYRRSWQYWANIHGYYGKDSPDGTVADHKAELQSSNMGRFTKYYGDITDQTAPDAIAQKIWATCEHSYTDNSNILHQANFFGWHRMYLYYYERVLRWAAQDDTLRLPYWDYTDPTQVLLPPPFGKPTASLYDAKRKSKINSGAASLNPNSTNIDSFLTNSNYLTAELSVEQGVHGYIHCTVGPTCPVAHMGDVPVAGNDPVFYSHHANIDRLWACWQHNFGSAPTGQAWENQAFSFVDETGTLQTRPVKDFLVSAPLGYVYDNDADCARKAAAVVAAAPAIAPMAAIAAAAPPEAPKPVTPQSVGSVAVTSPTTRVELNPTPSNGLAALAMPSAPGGTELVLRDIAADSVPGTLFDVYLSVKGDPGKRQHVGTISWFGTFSHRHAGHSGGARKTVTFAVTDALRALGNPASALEVTIEASDGLIPSDRTQFATQREEVQKAFRADANMRIGSIELRTVPKAAPKP